MYSLKNYLIIKTFSFVLLGLLSLLGCSEDNREDPYYDLNVKETVTAELENIPAYVLDYDKDCVFLCYSEYADVYYNYHFWGTGNSFPEEDNMTDDEHAKIKKVIESITTHVIGVSKADFDKYNIKVHSKVYVTASVTDNCSVYEKSNINGIIPLKGYSLSYHAYLQNIEPRY